MDGDREIDPRVALRLRYFQLETLAKNNQTQCDICHTVISKGEALETWKGNACVFVGCLSCYRDRGVLFTMYPDGLHIEPQEQGSTGFVRSSHSMLPSQFGPLGKPRG